MPASKTRRAVKRTAARAVPRKRSSAARGTTAPRSTTRTRTVTKVVARRVGGGGGGDKFSLWTIAKYAGLSTVGFIGTSLLSGFVPKVNTARYSNPNDLKRAQRLNAGLVIGAKAASSFGLGWAAWKVTKRPAFGLVVAAGGMASAFMDVINLFRAWWAARRTTTTTAPAALASATSTAPRLAGLGDMEEPKFSAGMQGIEDPKFSAGITGY